MRHRRFIFSPMSPLEFAVILFLALVLFTLFSGVVLAAFSKLGLPPDVAFTLFILAVVGSVVNIPVAEYRSYEPVLRVREVRFFGIPYPVPSFELAERKVVVSVNVGGALVPTAISLYELFRAAYLGQFGLLFNTVVAVAVAALLSHAVARPVRGLGIAMPMFFPPLLAVLLGWLLGSTNPPLLAYVSGTLGVLIGADLMNWNRLKNLGAPMVSIGGAGTFDGVFLAGVIAVLLV